MRRAGVCTVSGVLSPDPKPERMSSGLSVSLGIVSRSPVDFTLAQPQEIKILLLKPKEDPGQWGLHHSERGRHACGPSQEPRVTDPCPVASKQKAAFELLGRAAARGSSGQGRASPRRTLVLGAPPPIWG